MSDRTYSEAMTDLLERAGVESEPQLWRMLGEAPVIDVEPCACGEERCEPVDRPGGYHGGFRCLACGAIR